MAKTMNKRSGHKRSMHKHAAKKTHRRSGRKRTERKGKKSTRGYRKGSRSKTMKGKKDFTTKKSSKVFNRRRHYQKHAKGSRVIRRPYHKKGGRSNTTHHKPPTSTSTAAHKLMTKPHNPTTARKLVTKPNNPAAEAQAILRGYEQKWTSQPWMREGVFPTASNIKGNPTLAQENAAISKINKLDASKHDKSEWIRDIKDANKWYQIQLGNKIMKYGM